MYADATLLDDPKRTRYRFLRHQFQHVSNGGLDRHMRLGNQTKHDDARELCRWVGENVGKIEVKRHQHSILALTHIDHAFVRLTAESLLDNRMCVMSSSTEQRRQRWRKVFVEFEFHAALVSTTRSRASSAA